MSDKEDELLMWLKTGCQKKAVGLSIRKPMTNNDICNAARKYAPRIDRWDVSKILKALTEKGLVYCCNAEMKTGKLFWLTDYGLEKIGAAFHTNIEPRPVNLDWRAYSYLAAAPVRKAVLFEMLEIELGMLGAHTSANIWKRFRNTGRSFCVNNIIRSVLELKRMKLIRCVAHSKKRHLKLYSITSKGKLIAEELLR